MKTNSTQSVQTVRRIDLWLTALIFIVAPLAALVYLWSHLHPIVWFLATLCFFAWLFILFRRPKPGAPEAQAVSEVWVPSSREGDERSQQALRAPPEPTRVIDSRPWQERVAEIEAARSDEDEPPLGHEFHYQIQQLISSNNWDAARLMLQKVAYSMPNLDLDVEDKRAFALYVKDFAAIDPLFKQVLSIVFPAVAASPGIKQTEVYSLVPDLDKETIRYVLYYAHVLGLIERKKKGSTYQLFPFVEGVSERWDVKPSRKLSTAKVAKPTHRQIRQEMWARELPRLMECTEFCPYWQFRSVGDARDPAACKALDGRIERFDHPFWDEHAPWNCRRLECRCTVRAYTHQELQAKGLPIPD